MSVFANLTIRLGTANSTPVIATLDGANFLTKQTVTIGANAYVRSPPGDFPRISAEVGTAGGWTASNGAWQETTTFAPGSVVTFYTAEAAALVGIGAAS